MHYSGQRKDMGKDAGVEKLLSQASKELMIKAMV